MEMSNNPNIRRFERSVAVERLNDLNLSPGEMEAWHEDK